MKAIIDILFLIYDRQITIENQPVYQTQVFNQILHLNNIGYKIFVISFSDNKKFFYEKYGVILSENNIKFKILKRKSFLQDIFSVVKSFFDLNKYLKIKYIYVRSVWSALPLSLISNFINLRFIFDIRGDIIDETKFNGSSNFKISILQFLENYCLKKSNKICAVSSYLLSQTRLKIGYEKESYIIPSCVNTKEFQILNNQFLNRRNEIGFTEKDIIIVYSGGVSKYQMLSKILKFWFLLSKENKNFKFLLLLIKNSKLSKESFHYIDLLGKRLKILYLTRKQVSYYLPIADIGFIFRENRSLNKSASPVKFGEYLSSGLKVVATSYIGDISKQIVDNNLGLILSGKSGRKEINSFLNYFKNYNSKRKSYRFYSIKFAEEYYDWNSYNQVYARIYGKIN
tara:strand:- start:2588 stop:3784 length:1197 start_codon:yes stop_codon:yes gene_type:complete